MPYELIIPCIPVSGKFTLSDDKSVESVGTKSFIHLFVELLPTMPFGQSYNMLVSPAAGYKGNGK